MGGFVAGGGGEETWPGPFIAPGAVWRGRTPARASDAGNAAITDAAVDPNQVGRDDRRALKAGINPVLRDGGAAWHRVRAEGKSGVTECARSDLDADTRALGAANGIVDLPTGEVLPATEGGATLVSVAAPHEYRPWPEHSADARADGDRLCAHGEGHESDEWWASLAYARHGQPSRRFSLMLGGTGGGTPALVNALHAALGPYVSDPEPGALMGSRAVHETGLSPPMGAFVSPIRLALVDEVNAGVVDTRLVTRLSGDGRDHVAQSPGRTPDRRGHGDDRVCVPHRPRSAAQPPRCGGRGTPARDSVSDGP